MTKNLTDKSNKELPFLIIEQEILKLEEEGRVKFHSYGSRSLATIDGVDLYQMLDGSYQLVKRNVF